MHHTVRWIHLRCATLCAVALSCCVLFWAPRPTPPVFLLGGIQVNEPDHHVWTRTLADTGMNAVPVTVYAKQGDWDSANLWYEEQEPHVLREMRVARAAGLKVVLILRVALDHAFPRNRFLWHGMIMPGDEAALSEWFDRYEAFVLKWAWIAQREGVEVLGVSSEMNALTDTVPRSAGAILREYRDLRYWHTHYKARVLEFEETIAQRDLWTAGQEGPTALEANLDARAEAHLGWLEQVYFGGGAQGARRVQARQEVMTRRWRQIIKRARQVYSGQLTYASNFDSFQEVAFWDDLDVMGINAYFKLREEFDRAMDEPTMRAAFTRRWEGIFRDIHAFRGLHGIVDKPLIFTELGYTFRNNSTFEPWSYTAFSIIEWGAVDEGGERPRKLVVWKDQPINYQERQVAIDALQQATSWPEQAFFQGILYWKFSTNPAHADIEPFVMHVGPQSADPLQETLLRFEPSPTVVR